MNRDTHEMINRVTKLGISEEDAWALRRIAMTLHRWHELECGTEYGAVEREGENGDGRPFWYNPNARLGRVRHYVPDRERGALKRLAKIMARYPDLKPYVQGDPRGASLYILYPGCVPAGESADAYYSRGVAIYR